MIEHEFRPYADIPDLCVAEVENGDTCNRPREEHRRYRIETYGELEEFADDVLDVATTASGNEIRAARGAEALVNFAKRVGEDEFETTLGDLLADLMHAADVLQLDFHLALDRAHRHHEAEKAGSAL